jgi:hypothetical protein
MATMLPGLRFLDVDQVIETLEWGADRVPVSAALLQAAPTAYEAPGVYLSSVWRRLPEAVQEAINLAWDREARVAYIRPGDDPPAPVSA